METFQRAELKQRDPSNKDLDKAALQALAQAAINVELFTIPLYMISLFSIQGMHQITSAGNDFYQGRLWPGAAPSRAPESDSDNPTNALAFNHFFSVFIDEMLHLQLASNIAKILGVMPTYNSPVLQDKNFGWICYGPDNTILPHILDFQDTIAGYNDIKVKLDALTLDQNRLFLAIEENEEDARSIIDPAKAGNYFPSVPFENWSAGDTEENLPMFGTIGWMYKCLWQYIEIQYTDGTSLFEYVFNRGTLERDLFDSSSSYHKPEYPKMHTMASAVSPLNAMENILNMINAITDQGEGAGVAAWIRQMRGLLEYAPVEEQFRPDEAALNFNYPNYTDTGTQNNPSGDTVARSKNGGLDHHDRFQAIDELLKTGKVVTWDQWHASGNKWTAELLKTTGYELNKWPLPTAEDIAAALNNLKPSADNYSIFSQVAAGSIAGITRVLSDFWTNEMTSFPNPSMYGSGDRVSICWAVFGQYPDITKGIVNKTPGTLYHACQALSLESAGNSCAPVAVFHSCRGSNDCKAEGGCGFVQVVGETKVLCGQKVLKEQLSPTLKPAAALQGILKFYSAPSDNACAGNGGCAIPISASQLYPLADSTKPDQKTGEMELYDFSGETSAPVKLPNRLTYSMGDKVYDVAWNAYIEVLKHRQTNPLPEKPAVDSDLRLAFPPST